MKTMKLNPVCKGGILIRKSDNGNIKEFSSQSLNWWINNEVTFYISQGYKIDVSTQYYNSKTERFI